MLISVRLFTLKCSRALEAHQRAPGHEVGACQFFVLFKPNLINNIFNFHRREDGFKLRQIIFQFNAQFLHDFCD